MNAAHYNGATFIQGPDSWASYIPDYAAPQKWLISLTINYELARSFGINNVTLPAVIDDFGNLVVVK